MSYPAGRSVKASEAFQLAVFRNYANFSGRSSRGAYWWYGLTTILASTLAAFVDARAFGENGFSPFRSMFGLATVVPTLAIGFRRMHDIGRSGWWSLLSAPAVLLALLLFAVPIAIDGVGPILVILSCWLLAQLFVFYLAAQPGQREHNRFGADDEAGRESVSTQSEPTRTE